VADLKDEASGSAENKGAYTSSQASKAISERGREGEERESGRVRMGRKRGKGQ